MCQQELTSQHSQHANPTQRTMRGLRLGTQGAGKSSKKGARNEPPPKLNTAEWPVVDWRCFDQRNQGYYTWLEPPMQDDDLKCARCDLDLVRVHRCGVSMLQQVPLILSILISSIKKTASALIR